MIKAIIFDMDGVIVDSISFHFGIWREVMAGYNVKVSDETFAEINGMDTPSVAEHFQEKYSLDVHPVVIANEKRKIALERMQHGLPLFPGAENTLILLKRLGYRIGLGSSSIRMGIEISLVKLIGKFEFDAIVGEEDVQHAKPFPDIFLKCAERMEILPEECIVVEDAENGIIAAKKAGMKAIAITTTSKEKYFRDSDIKPDMIIKNISEINSELIKKLEN
jgi:HAD superfamily hydrolase (TIGR01509 family)